MAAGFACRSKTAFCLALVLFAMCVAGCKEKPKDEDIVVDEIVERPARSVVALPADTRKGDVRWIGGSMYSYNIVRAASDSLPQQSAHGQKYKDNTVALTVTRADGTQFFHKTFTKVNFAPALPADIAKTGVLLGITFDKVQGEQLLFTVSVGSPDETDEEFYYVTLTLDRMGRTACRK